MTDAALKSDSYSKFQNEPSAEDLQAGLDAANANSADSATSVAPADQSAPDEEEPFGMLDEPLADEDSNDDQPQPGKQPTAQAAQAPTAPLRATSAATAKISAGPAAGMTRRVAAKNSVASAVPKIPGVNAPAAPAGAAPETVNATNTTADYRLFYLRNADRFLNPETGQVNVQALNKAFRQDLHDHGYSGVENVDDETFVRRLKQVGFDFTKQEQDRFFPEVNKAYGTFERNEFSTYAGDIRNFAADTPYARAMGYRTLAPNDDQRIAAADVKANAYQFKGFGPGGDLSQTLTGQMERHYGQEDEALFNNEDLFRPVQPDKQTAKDSYKGIGLHKNDAPDGQVFFASMAEDGTQKIAKKPVPYVIRPDDLVTSTYDRATGTGRLVVWAKGTDPNRVGEVLNTGDISTKRPRTAESTVDRLISGYVDLLPSTVLKNMVFGKETDDSRYSLETDGWGLGDGLSRGTSAFQAQNRRLGGLGLGALATGANAIGAKRAGQYLREAQYDNYRKAAQVKSATNTDQQGDMFSSSAALWYQFTTTSEQQLMQIGLSMAGSFVGMPELGFAYMGAIGMENGYSDVRAAGGSEELALGVGVALGGATYATEALMEMGVSKYLRKLATGALSAELRTGVQNVVRREQQALVSSVLAEARGKALGKITAAETQQLTSKYLPKFAAGMKTGVRNLVEKLERTATGNVLMGAAKETVQEGGDQLAQQGIYSAARGMFFTDENGEPDKNLPEWVKEGLVNGNNPLAEKSSRQILEEWFQASRAGGLMGGVFGVPGAWKQAHHATLAQAMTAAAEEEKDRQIARYLVENNFSPEAVKKLTDELATRKKNYQLGVRTRVDGSPASKDGTDSENTQVYNSLLNKVNVLSRLANDTNLKARMTPMDNAGLIKELVEYGNENVRTSQGLDILFRVHEKQQDLQRLLSGYTPVMRDPLTGAPLRPDLSDPANPTGPNSNLNAVLPGFDASKGSLGMSQADYEMQRTQRRAKLKDEMLTAGQSDADAETALSKGIDEEGKRATGSGTLAIITRSREVGAWYENQALIQQLRQKLADTDASDFEKRRKLREQIAQAQLESEPLEQALSLAISQDTDGVLSRVKNIADAQLELNDLTVANADVFNGNLLKTHLQEGYVLHQRKRLQYELAQAQSQNNPLLTQRLEAELNVLEQEFFVSGQVDATRLGLRNGQRKEFIAAQLAQQTAVNTASSAAAQAAQLPLDALVQAVAPDPANPVSIGDLLLNHVDKAEALAAALTAAGGVSLSQRKAVNDLTARATSQAAQARQVIEQARQDRRKEIRDEVIQEGLLALYDDQAGIDAADPDDVREMIVDLDSDGDTDTKTDARLALEPADPTLDTVERLEKAAQVLAAQKDSKALLDQDADYFDVEFGTGTSGFDPFKNNAPVNAIEDQLALVRATLGAYTEKLDKSALAEAIANNLNLGQLEAARDQVLANIGHLGINTGIHNRLLLPDVLPATANLKDYLTQNETTADRILKISLHQLLELNQAIAAVKNSGDRYAVDDRLRGHYLDRSGEQLRVRVLGAAATKAAAAATPAAQAAYDAAKQMLDDLDALNLDPNGQDRKALQDNLQAGVELLTKAEQQLRQIFTDDAQRGALYAELLNKAGTDVLGAAAAIASPEQVLVAGQRALLSTEDQNIEPYAGTGLLLQNLFSVDRGQFAAAYGAQAASQVSPAGTIGQVSPLASLEQEQVVYDIVSAGLSSVASQTGYGTFDAVYAKQSGQKDIKTSNGQGGFLTRFTLYVTGYAGAGKTFKVAGNGIATLARLLGKDNTGNKLRVMSSAPHAKQQANLRDSLQSASDLLKVESAELSVIIGTLQNDSLAADVLVVDEATILNTKDADSLILEVEAFNERRLASNPGASPLRLLLLGDPAQLAGPQTNGNRDRSQLFTEDEYLIKPTARALTQVYRTGLQTLFNGQDVYRGRILSTDAATRRDTSPVDGLSWNQTGSDLSTLEGVQYLSETTQREQIRDHIAAVEAWNLANPAEKPRTLAVIVSPGDVAEEIRALTALGVAGAAEYVTDSQKTGTLSVDKAQGQSFTYVYASLNERDAYVAGGLQGNQLNRPDSTLRALNVALSRAQRYASIRLQKGQAMPNNPKDTQAGFTDETPAARTARNQGKLDSLAALAKLADTTGTTGGAQAPAGTTTNTGSNTGTGTGSNTTPTVADQLKDLQDALDWALASPLIADDAQRLDALENFLMSDVLTLQADAANQTNQEQADIEAFRQKVITAIGTLQGQAAAGGTQGSTGTSTGPTAGSATGTTAGPAAGATTGTPPVNGPIVLPAVTALVDMVETLTGAGVSATPGGDPNTTTTADPMDAAVATPTEPDGFLAAPVSVPVPGRSFIGQLTDEAQQQLTDLGQALLAARGALNVWLAANPQADAAAVMLVTAQLNQAEAHYAYFAARQQAAVDAARTLSPDVDGQVLQAGEAVPQQAGLFVVLGADGMPESAVYQHPVVDKTTGQTTYQPFSETFSGSPMQRLNQLQAWTRKQIKELRAAQIALENDSVARLARENKGILHLHAQPELAKALQDNQARERLAKAGMISRLLNRVLGQRRAAIAVNKKIPLRGTGYQGAPGQLTTADFAGLPKPSGKGAFKGGNHGTFRLRYQEQFRHGLRNEATEEEVYTRELFLVEYVEDGDVVTVGVLRKNEDSTPGTIRSTRNEVLEMDRALQTLALDATRNGNGAGFDLGKTLRLQSVKPARYDRLTPAERPATLAEFRKLMNSKGIAVSKPYVVTVRGNTNPNDDTNVVFDSGYSVNAQNADAGDTRRGISGRAVVFTAFSEQAGQVLSDAARTDDLIKAAIALGQSADNQWTAQQTWDYLYFNHDLELVYLDTAALTLDDYMRALHETPDWARQLTTQGQLDAQLVTRLDPANTKDGLAFRQDEDARAKKFTGNRKRVLKGFFTAWQARRNKVDSSELATARQTLSDKDIKNKIPGLVSKLVNTFANPAAYGVGLVAQVEHKGKGKNQNGYAFAPTHQAALDHVLTLDQQAHLLHIVNLLLARDNDRLHTVVKDEKGKDRAQSYSVRYAQDLLTYLAYLDHQPGFAGLMSKAWEDDTLDRRPGKHYYNGYGNPVKYNPVVDPGARTGTFSPMAELQGLENERLLLTTRQERSMPTVVLDLNSAVQALAAQSAPAPPAPATGAATGAGTSGAATSEDPTAENDVEVLFNRNLTGITQGTEHPADVEATARYVFGEPALPAGQRLVAFDQMGSWQDVLGAMGQGVLYFNRLANGLIDKATVGHEVVHRLMRVIAPAKRAQVYAQARELMKKQGWANADDTTFKEVDEWLAQYGGRVLQDFLLTSPRARQTVSWLKDHLPRLHQFFMWLRDAARRLTRDPDHIAHVFADAALGRYRHAAYLAPVYAFDDELLFARNAKGQRLADWMSLERAFGGRERLQHATDKLLATIQHHQWGYKPGKKYQAAEAAIREVRAAVVKQAAAYKEQGLSPNPNVDMDDATYRAAMTQRMVQPWLLPPADDTVPEAEREARKNLTPFDIIVRHALNFVPTRSGGDALVDNAAVASGLADAMGTGGQQQNEAFEDSDDDEAGETLASDSENEHQAEAASSGQNAIGRTTEYIADKNREATMGEKLKFFLQNIPHYEYDADSKQYRLSSTRTQSNPVVVGQVLEDAIRVAFGEAAKRGDIMPSIHDLKAGLNTVIGGTNSDRKDVAASVFAFFFNEMVYGQDERTMELVPERAIATYDQTPAGLWAPNEAKRYSLYEVAYPSDDDQLRRVNPADVQVQRFGRESQRLLTQLLMHYANIERRIFASVSMNRGLSQSDQKAPATHLKNYNQSTLVSRFFKKQGDTYVPDPARLQAFYDLGFRVRTDPTNDRMAYIERHGKQVMQLELMRSGSGEGFWLYGDRSRQRLSPQEQEDLLFDLYQWSGLKMPRKLLREMLQAGRASNPFYGMIGQMMAAHVRAGTSRELLGQLGVDLSNPRRFWADPDYDHNTDDILEPLGQKKTGKELQMYSPTFYFSDIQRVANQQQQVMQAQQRRYEFSPDNEKMFRNQLQNTFFQRLREAKMSLADYVRGRHFPVDEYGNNLHFAQNDLEKGNRNLYLNPEYHANPYQTGQWGFTLHVANALTNEAKGKRESLVGASAKELHTATINELFGQSLRGKGKKKADEDDEQVGDAGTLKTSTLMGAISDKATQYIGETTISGNAGGWQQGLLAPGSPEARKHLRNIKRRYEELFLDDSVGRLMQELQRQDVKGSYQTMQKLRILEALRNRRSLPRLRRAYDLLLQSDTLTSPESHLIKGVDYSPGESGKPLRLGDKLAGILDMSDEDFIASIEVGSREEARQLVRDGYHALPFKMVKEMGSRGLLGNGWSEEQQALFAPKNKSNSNAAQQYQRSSYQPVDAQGKPVGEARLHPALLAFSLTNFVQQFYQENALVNSELYFGSTTNKVKRNIVSSTNFEAPDIHNPRGVGRIGQAQIIHDFTWDEHFQQEDVLDEQGQPVLETLTKEQVQAGRQPQPLQQRQSRYYVEELDAQGQPTGNKTVQPVAPGADNAFWALEAMEEEGVIGSVADLKKDGSLQDGFGFKNMLSYFLMMESEGYKYSDRSQLKAGLHDSRSPDGSPKLYKASFGFLSNAYLAVANQHAYQIMVQSLGGYDSPLYQQWVLIREQGKATGEVDGQTGAAAYRPWTNEELQRDDDWKALLEYFVDPDNREELQPYLSNISLFSSSSKITKQGVNRLDNVMNQAWTRLQYHNEKFGRVVSLHQDTKTADIANITQENDIIAALGENYKSSQQVFEYLRQLAKAGELKLDALIKAAGGNKQYFMGQLERLLQNLGNVSNTLDLAQARMSPNLPLLEGQLRSAIASAIKSFSTKQRFNGLRATVQSSTGLVNMYNVRRPGSELSERLTKQDLVNERLATVNRRGQLVFAPGTAIETDELHFNRLWEKNNDGSQGRQLNKAEVKQFMRARLRYEKDAASKAYVDALLPKLHLAPMEIMISRDFLKEFGIPAQMSLRQVLQAGEGFFVQQQVSKYQQRLAAMGSSLANKEKGVPAAEALAEEARDEATGLTSAQLAQTQAAGQQQWHNLQQILNGKGTRIPVTNFNSVQMVKVVGFFDGQANTVLVPSEMQVVAGADNDGDMFTLEFLQLNGEGLSPEPGTPQETRQALMREKMAVIGNAFNIDQLFKPIDFSDLKRYANAFKARAGKSSDDGIGNGSEDVSRYGPLGGFYRHTQNVAHWIANQAGKKGVGFLVKGRQVFNALYTVSRHYAAQDPAYKMARFGEPVYWMGRKIEQLTEEARRMTYWFENLTNASLDNAKDPILWYLNVNDDTYGMWSSGIKTLQNFDELEQLLNHPFARRIVQRVQRANHINATYRKNLLTELRNQLIGEGKVFDEDGEEMPAAEGATPHWGFDYTIPKDEIESQVALLQQQQAQAQPGDEATEDASGFVAAEKVKTETLFKRVQQQQQDLYNQYQILVGQGMKDSQARAQVYPDLQAERLNDPRLSAAQRYELEKFIVENLFLQLTRAQEDMSVQHVLKVLDGAAGDERDNQRQLGNLVIALEYGSMPLSQAIAKLEVLSSDDPQVRALEIEKKKFKTGNSRTLYETNGFVRAATQALLRDYRVRRELFTDRLPQVQQTFAVLEKANRAFFRDRANYKLRHRAFQRWLDAKFLTDVGQLPITEGEQASHPLLSRLAGYELGTVLGRAGFVRDAVQYLQQLRLDDERQRQFPVSASPLLAHLQTSADEDYGGEYVQLAGGTDLDADDKRLLSTHFAELSTRFGASGRALQQVLAMYSLLHHGLSLGRGSFAEVFTAEVLRGYSAWRDAFHQRLASGADEQNKLDKDRVKNAFRSANRLEPSLILQQQHQELNDFVSAFTAYHPQSTKEWKRAYQARNDQEAEQLDSFAESSPDEYEKHMQERGRFSTFYDDAEGLPDLLSIDELRVGTKLTAKKYNEQSTLPEYVHLRNQQTAGGYVLYRRDDTGKNPVWRRQFPTAHARLNRYGEHAFSNGPVFANEQNLTGAALRENPAYIAFQARAKAYASRNSLLQEDPDTKEKSYEVALAGNQQLTVREERDCTGAAVS